MSRIAAIIKEPDEEQAEAVLDALLRMSSDIKSPEVLSTLASRLSSLGGCLSTFMDAAVVVEVLFAVLNKLDLKSFGTRDNAENVLKAMDSHSDGEETLVEVRELRREGHKLVSLTTRKRPPGLARSTVASSLRSWRQRRRRARGTSLSWTRGGCWTGRRESSPTREIRSTSRRRERCCRHRI